MPTDFARLPPTTGRVYATTRDQAAKTSGTITGILYIDDRTAFVLFDTGATHSIISTTFAKKLNMNPTPLIERCSSANLLPIPFVRFDVILGMDDEIHYGSIKGWKVSTKWPGPTTVTGLMRKGEKFVWTNGVMKVLRELKRRFVSASGIDFPSAAVVFALKIWRHYCHGEACDMIYRSSSTIGKANVVADALSRKSGMIACFDSMILHDLERLDVELCNVEDGKLTEFCVDDDVLCWFEDRLCVPNDQALNREERTIQTLEDMLRACALEWTGCWDEYLCLVEFAYIISWHDQHQVAPFELLYGRKCRAPICWDEVGERLIEGPELIEITNEKVAVAKEKLKEARIATERDYNDKHRRDLEFQVGDRVFLKVCHLEELNVLGSRASSVLDSSVRLRFWNVLERFLVSSGDTRSYRTFTMSFHVSLLVGIPLSAIASRILINLVQIGLICLCRRNLILSRSSERS
ncbi:putative nucleotidyltransferase, ribonuclease H [Tanacetum coccineum]